MTVTIIEFHMKKGGLVICVPLEEEVEQCLYFLRRKVDMTRENEQPTTFAWNELEKIEIVRRELKK